LIKRARAAVSEMRLSSEGVGCDARERKPLKLLPLPITNGYGVFFFFFFWVPNVRVCCIGD